jgi:hypothetical protein
VIKKSSHVLDKVINSCEDAYEKDGLSLSRDTLISLFDQILKYTNCHFREDVLLLHCLSFYTQEKTDYDLNGFVADRIAMFFAVEYLLAEGEDGLQVGSHPPGVALEGIAETFQTQERCLIQILLS